jgi:hypothetical protein
MHPIRESAVSLLLHLVFQLLLQVRGLWVVANVPLASNDLLPFDVRFQVLVFGLLQNQIRHRRKIVKPARPGAAACRLVNPAGIRTDMENKFVELW